MEAAKENKMGVMPVNRLLISMAAPMMLAMVVQALYNIVDSIYVSWINEEALTALSLAFPVQNLMLAVGGGTGVGMNALLSKSLGEKNFDEANRAAMNGILLAFLSWLLFLVLGFCFSATYMNLQASTSSDVAAGANIPLIIEYGTSYMSIVTMASFGMFGQFVFERLLQSTGLTVYSMITQGVGAIINIILDPFLIFGWWIFPEMGVAGAAIATVIGQSIAMCLGWYLNIRRNTEITLRVRGFRPSGRTIGRIYRVGLPSIIMQSIGSVMTFGMYRILMSFTPTASTVFGVYFRLQSFVFMPVFGLNNGMVPILAYNYGARRKDRMIQTIRLSITYAVAIMVVGFLIFQLAPGALLSLFNASDQMMEIGRPALRIISICFLLAGYSIICTSVFQSLGWGVASMLMSLIRQLIVLLPSAWLLSRTRQLNLVWWAFPIAELAALIVCTVFLLLLYHRLIKPIGESEPPAVSAAQP